MKKQTNQIETVKTDAIVTETPVVVNPFEGLAAATTASKSSRKLAYTAVLQDKARAMATELIKSTTTKLELRPLASSMIQDKTPESLLAFIAGGITAAELDEAATVLADCPTDDLPKMLESQRSNRSKAKKTGLTAMTAVVTYVSSMIAELLIRKRTGKAYMVTGKLETDHAKLAQDQETLVKRINSLASKQSRLRPLAKYDADAKAKLAAVEKELAELRAMRPGKTKTVVKSVSVDQVKTAISNGTIDQAMLQALLDAIKTAQQTEQVDGQLEMELEAAAQ